MPSYLFATGVSFTWPTHHIHTRILCVPHSNTSPPHIGGYVFESLPWVEGVLSQAHYLCGSFTKVLDMYHTQMLVA